MAFFQLFTIFCLALIFLTLLLYIFKAKNFKLKSWHVLGMISVVLANMHRLHDYATNFLIRNGGTFMLKGPWFANMDMLVTTHPLDIHHILSKNFSNYPKGDKFRDIFDFFGDGIINVDGHLWEMHRKNTLSITKHVKFQSIWETIVWSTVERGLVPVLESKLGTEIDLQQIFQKLTFDNILKLLVDIDLQSLSLDFHCIPCESAIPEIEEALFTRYLFPGIVWKLQRLFRMGNEKKLRDAWKVIDEFIHECLARTQNESATRNEEDASLGLFASMLRENKDKKCLRDSVVTLIGAGRETTSTALSWFFYLVAKHPIIEDKIRTEIYAHLEGDKKWDIKQLHQLVYLHGALCEALRLYPPIPFNSKSPLLPDVLPSGHKVNRKTRVLLYFYGMGRMKTIWGDDCKEFKPERWILKEGGIKHEPSYKFTAFNAGPRACLGKDMSFTQMKIVAAKIMYHYHVELVQGHLVFPSNSMILRMKDGLKVRLTKLI
ncbi:alkane hydroxylase MAH1-like [Rutidosis leptorrhynchoides]|uniref:alkane hydroxylase MAH1-like n=1 Tax=Rutidosis leptorrhynchoides TaxID=125765 RepID=UPI003A99156E